MFKIYQILHFSARFAQILGVLIFMILISFSVCRVFCVKSEIATGSLNYGPQKSLEFLDFVELFPLEFSQKWPKKACVHTHLKTVPL